MRLRQLLDGITTVSEDLPITALTCDSRRVTEGCLFVCIDGVDTDGHGFAAEALANGAAAVVVERDLGLPQQIRVSDTRQAWALLSANWFGHPAKRLKLIGVTGTNGKTSTVFMLRQMLETCGFTVGLCGTVQHSVGDRTVPSDATTPDAYTLQKLLRRMVDAGCDFAVMEVSSHALAQQRVAGLRFDAAVFTNLTQDHLDYHQTMENYGNAKRQLFLQSDCAVVPFDDPWSARMTAGLTCPITRFSAGEGGEVTATDVVYRPDGVDFTVAAGDRQQRVSLPVPGEFSVKNAIGAVAAALAVGLPFEAVCHAVSYMTGVKGRAEIVPTDRPFTVVIDYAHTPDGLEQICRTLQHGLCGRLMVLFGCGGDRDRTKRPLMGAVAAKWADLTVVTSDNPRFEDPNTIIDDILQGIPSGSPTAVIPDRTEAIRWVLEHAEAGDTVLLAGKGHETYQIVNGRVLPYDERQIVAEVLAKRKD